VSVKGAVAAEGRGLEAHGNDAAGGGKAQGPGSQASQVASTGSTGSTASTSQRPTAIKFAGATFVPADSDDPDVLVFTSGDAQARASVAMLESMGLADKWQKAGSASPHPGLPPTSPPGPLSDPERGSVSGCRASTREGDTEGGQILVCITNHGPAGAETSIRLRLGDGDLRGMAKALGALGIEVAA